MSWQGKYITSIHHRPIPQSQPHPNVSPFPFDPTNTNPPYPHHTAYVDQSLVGTGKVARAAILGQKGGVWAASPGYTVSLAILFCVDQVEWLSDESDNSCQSQNKTSLLKRPLKSLELLKVCPSTIHTSDTEHR